jgi:inward rectifier potassium channel
MPTNINNSGFGTSVNAKYARFVNKDGSHNVIHKGRTLYERSNLYQYLINISWFRFLVLVALSYLLINFLFAVIYYYFCLPQLLGLIKGDAWQNFQEAYFFSAQTLTTVGYGRISPSGFLASTIAAVEALIGILTLAINTGLLYGRFVKPQAHIKFSHNALIAPFKGGKALMFRLAPIKNATLSDMAVKVTLSMMKHDEHGNPINRFFGLPLEISALDFFVTSWTLVHKIDPESPLHGLDHEAMMERDVEILVYIRAYDENFCSTVVKRTSFTYHEIVHGAKFEPVYYEDPDGKGSVVEHQKLNRYKSVAL